MQKIKSCTGATNSIITELSKIYESNGAEVTPSRFLRWFCFYMVLVDDVKSHNQTIMWE